MTNVEPVRDVAVVLRDTASMAQRQPAATSPAARG